MNNEQNTDHVSDSGKKVSSIDWFHRKYWKLLTQLENGKITIREYLFAQDDLVKQAREMHRQEIEEAHYIGQEYICNGGQPDHEHYYNETFKQ